MTSPTHTDIHQDLGRMETIERRLDEAATRAVYEAAQSKD